MEIRRTAKRVADGLMITVFFYVLTSIFSLYLVSRGVDIPYMEFWHAPWQWLMKLLESVGIV